MAACTAARQRTLRPSCASSSPTALERGSPSRSSIAFGRSSQMRPAAAELSELLERCWFPEPGRRVDLAVSGGPDSCGLALLASAAGLVATIHHVEHGLRPGASDAALVAQLAERLGAPYVAHRVAVDPGGNLEARARSARLAVLPAGVLTGHTMDDQAETVVLNLLR